MRTDTKVTRARVKQQIVSALARKGIAGGLRGSWKYDDFHLSPDGGSTRSDLDLVCNGASPTYRHRCAKEIRSKLAGILSLHVSVHAGDDLLDISLADAMYLSVGEFIAKTRHIAHDSDDYRYTLAKICLLLLRIDRRERYAEVASRLTSPEAHTALCCKLGQSNEFSKDAAHVLLQYSNGAPVVFFLDRCVDRQPDKECVADIMDQVSRCPTITPWLAKRLASKMSTR